MIGPQKSTMRMKSVATSGTLKLTQMALDLEEKGKKIIKFTIGEPDFKTPDFIIDAAIEALRRGETHYTSYKGILPLRETVAEIYHDRGIDYTPDEIMITPTKMGIYFGIMTNIDDEEEALLPDPCWVSYKEITRISDGYGIYVSTILDDGTIGINEEELKEAITVNTKMIIINTPNNPTGRVYTKDELKIIADLAEDHDLIVISDEVYEKLTYGREHISIASIGNMWERTITVSGFSKAYAMTGWRIGWVAAPKYLIKEMWKLQQHTLTCVPPFIQYAGLEALNNEEEARKAIESMLNEYRKRREIMYNILKSIDVITVGEPEGAFYMFPRVNLPIDSYTLATRLLQEAGVGVTPGSAFGPHGEFYLRLSYATSIENIKEGMAKFKDAIEKYASEML